ncbi:hypothetical protein EC968_002671 [Mortierella alpina]|nr:hypothetical protein EC968_002671 [Mortierella alpina]
MAVLRHYTERPNLWQQSTSYPMQSSSLAQNEDTYTHAIIKGIILSVVGDLELLDHWSRDPLPTPAGFEAMYTPDYFGEYDGYPLMIVEIKKPGTTDDDLEGDRRKLPCMRLNAAILMELEMPLLDAIRWSTIIAESHGLVLYT